MSTLRQRRPFRMTRLVPLLGAVLLAAALSLGAALAVHSAHATPEIDVVYANGQTMYMIGPHLNTNPNPNLLAQSDALYVLTFPVNTSTCGLNCHSITLPSGYQPQCDPCYHPGLPTAFIYHDHVLTGAPGFGTNGTAGSYKGPWQIIVLRYTPTYAFSSTFKPITSDEALDAAEAAGDFLPIAKGINPANPYEIPTGHVLICPLVSSHA